MSDNIQTILPIMYGPLHENSKNHWNRYCLRLPEHCLFRTIHGLLYTALKSLIDMDPDLYNKCEQEYEQSCINRQHDAEERRHRWEVLQRVASSQPNTIDSNHVSSQDTDMQIDVVVNVPEPIPEEDEHQQGEDANMSVDAEVSSPPAA